MSNVTKVKCFQCVLREKHDVQTEMGQDSNGACGELVVGKQANLLAASTGLLTDIEDLPP